MFGQKNAAVGVLWGISLSENVLKASRLVSTQKIEKQCFISKFPIFESFLWAVALCYQGLQLWAGSLAQQHYLRGSSLVYQACPGFSSYLCCLVACQGLASEA